MALARTEVVREIYRLLKAGDIEGLLANMDMRTRIEDYAEDAPGPYTSQDDVRAFFTDRATVWKRWGIQPQEYVQRDERIFVPVRLWEPATAATERPTAWFMFHVWDVAEDGKIARLRIYRDRAEALDAADRAG
jgi:ketosteroid isomerase-like protein